MKNNNSKNIDDMVTVNSDLKTANKPKKQNSKKRETEVVSNETAVAVNGKKMSKANKTTNKYYNSAISQASHKKKSKAGEQAETVASAGEFTAVSTAVNLTAEAQVQAGVVSSNADVKTQSAGASGAQPTFKKRVFSESEQNSGSYNVGMKKKTTNSSLPLSQSVREKVLNKMAEVNPNLGLEAISQEELISSTMGGKRTKPKKSDKVKVIFLGGVGEIGKNITAIECGEDMMLIDSGLAFPTEDMPGIDLVIPDFTYIKENAHKLKGIVITHGHEDHIGSLPYLLKDVKAPIYGSEISLTLIDNKVREHKLTGVKGFAVKPGYNVRIGCFKVEFVKVNHSIPGAFALSIDTPSGTIFHTGDFKIDYEPIDKEVIDLSRIAEIGRKGVSLLLCESTNVERPGFTPSEKRVGENLERIFMDNANKRLFVATFSSNLYRIAQIVDLAIKYNRRVAVIGRSMINNIDAGMKIGAFKFNKSVFIDVEKIASLEDKNVLVLSTGSQGEPRSALSRLANGEFSRVEIGENDTIIFSSSPIPGNENMINNVINNLYKKGAVVVDENVHASGHACQEELKLIHTLIKPKFFIPVHGEFRHLKEHTDLAKKLGMPATHCLIPEIGNVVEITNTAMVVRGNVQAGEQLVDGLGIGDADSVVLKDRKQLSEDGLVIVVIGVSDNSGDLINEPYLITRGFVYADEAEKLCEEAKGVLLDTLKLIDMKETKDWNELRNTIRKPLRNFFFKRTMRTPMILPIVFRV